MTRNITICVGTIGSGAWVSPDGGESWHRVQAGLWSESRVFALSVHPAEPRTVFAGADDGIYKSRDGGRNWHKLAAEIAAECPNVRIPRVTALAVDPTDSRTVWAGIEVDGVRRSRDGGDSWTRIAGGLDDPDIHDIAVSVNGGSTVLTSTPREIFASTDSGETWQG